MSTKITKINTPRKLRRIRYDDEAVAEHYKNIYESWKKTGAAKLKLLEICSPCPRDAVEDIMSDMTIKFRLT